MSAPRHDLTGSKIRLARECAWWLRPDLEIPAEEASATALVGTAAHAAIEAETKLTAAEAEERVAHVAFLERLRGGEVDGLTEAQADSVEELRASWARWRKSKATIEPAALNSFADDGLPLPAAEVVVAIAGDGSPRAFYSPEAKTRDYSRVPAGFIPATIDCIYIEKFGPAILDMGPSYRNFDIVVTDYKTGRGPHTLAEHSDQLTHAGAAVLLLAPTLQSVVLEVLHVTPDGCFPSRRRMFRWECGEWSEVLVGIVKSFISVQPEARPGLHCDAFYCKARPVCPVTRSLLLSSQYPDAHRRLPIVGPIESNEQAFAVHVATKLLAKWLDERATALKRYADVSGGITSPDGRVYRARSESRETARLDVEGAERVLRTELGPYAERAIKRTVRASWEGIRDAIREMMAAEGVEGTIKEREQRTRHALREAGALKVSEFTKYSWTKEGK